MPYKDKEKAKACGRAYSRKLYAKFPRRGYYKDKYNLTLLQIDWMLANQRHKCKICGELLTEKRRNIDHNHKTGKVRGILCDRCNIGLGWVEDMDFVRKAIVYLMMSGETVLESWDTEITPYKKAA